MPTLALRPAALAPEPQGEPLLGPVTAAAEAAGVRPGMRLGEGLATCPALGPLAPGAAGGAGARGAGRCRRRDRLGGDPPRARGRGLLRRDGVARRRVFRDTRGRTALR